MNLPVPCQGNSFWDPESLLLKSLPFLLFLFQERYSGYMQRTPPWPPEQAQQPNLLANLLQSRQQQQQPQQPQQNQPNLFAGLVGLANA